MSEQEYELVGEEYASDGLWCSVVICEEVVWKSALMLWRIV